MIGNYYYNHLKNIKEISLQPNKLNYSKNIYWVFGLVLKKNHKISFDDLSKELNKRNIGTRPFFWPIHKQDAYKKIKSFKNLKLPNSEFISKNGLYLPSGLGLSKQEIKYVKDVMLDIFK